MNQIKFTSRISVVSSRTAKQRGFTLIESVVATSLFVVAMVSIIGVYLSTVKINRRTDLIRTASENSRFIAEFLSKEIRNGQINYTGPANSPCTLPPFTSPSYTFSMINVDGDRLCFFLGTDAGLVSATGPNLWLIKNNLGMVKVNSTNVQITKLNFYVSPTANPYSASLKVQPRVSVVGTLKATSGAQDNVTMPIQTSISIPVYDLP